MKNKINIKKTIETMKEQNLQVLSIDKENMVLLFLLFKRVTLQKCALYAVV